ncbi:MAG: hypothetical protein AAGI22_04385 [Planctomycetota bacterium]
MLHLPAARRSSLALLIALPLAAPSQALAAPATAAALAAAAAPLVQKDKKKKKKAPKGVHRNTRFGFEFRVPKKWSNIAIKTDEEWLGAKYVSETEYSWTDPDDGWTWQYAPELIVVAFPREVMEKGGKDVEETEKDGEKVVKIKFTNPYKDYDDFLRRTFKDGGFYKSAEEEDEIDGVKVTKRTYLAEKLARTGPKTIETWIYHTDDVDYAVQIVGLTKSWKKIQQRTKSVRSSFKLIEREGPIKHSGATGDQVTLTFLDLNEGTPEERKSRAIESEKTMHEKAIARLPDEGWTHKREKRVLLLSSADKRWSKRVLSHTNNLLDWLDDNYGYLNTGSYMRAPIIRCCKDRDERSAFAAGVDSGGMGGWWFLDRELVTYKDDTGWIDGWAIDDLNTQLYRYWMSENNGALQTGMPSWIDSGLQELVSQMRMDSRKPVFRVDAWEVERFREAANQGNLSSARDLFLMTTKEYHNYEGSGGNFWSRRSQAAMLINYLASPEMRKGRGAKGLLEEYLKNMITVIDQIEKEREADLDEARKKLKDKDGEKEYRAARRKIFVEQEKLLLERTFNLTFHDWDERDWKQFEKGFNSAYGVK